MRNTEERVTPARFLNEKSGFWGLSVWDLAALGYLLVSSHSAFSHFDLEVLAFLFTGIIAFGLIGLRLKHRPKTVRDYLKFQLSSRGFL